MSCFSPGLPPAVGFFCGSGRQLLARHGRDRNGVLRFEQMAGLVDIAVERDADGAVSGAVIAAPQALSLGIELPVAGVSACAGLKPADILTAAHPPVQASLGVKFVLAQVAPDALSDAGPDLAAFRALDGHRFATPGAAELAARLVSQPRRGASARWLAS